MSNGRNSRYIPAAHVAVGDVLVLADGAEAPVTFVYLKHAGVSEKESVKLEHMPAGCKRHRTLWYKTTDAVEIKSWILG